MNKMYIETPLIVSTPLSNLLGKPVYLKMEALQPGGSFKIRGIGNLCSHYAREGAKCFVSFSGGNAGLAVAYAGKVLGIPVKVVVPSTSSEAVRQKIRDEGAEVIVHWDNWTHAEKDAIAMAAKGSGAYIHPFDHPLIWQGHATLIEEIANTSIKPGAIVASVGGGGLLSGIALGLSHKGWYDVPIIALETEGAASYHAAIQADACVTLEKIDSIATTLGAKCVAEEALNWTNKHPIFSEIVSDRAAIHSCLKFAGHHRLLVEPACGAALAAVYEHLPVLKSYPSILVVVCGGSGVSLDLLDKWAKQFSF